MAITHYDNGSVRFENGKNGTAVAIIGADGAQVGGSALTMTHTTASATGSTSAMLASNTARKYALLQNIGSVDVFIKVAAAAVASQGICLYANGGSYEISQSYGNLATGAINGITASGTATVLVTEGA